MSAQSYEATNPLFTWKGRPKFVQIVPLGLSHVLASAMGVVAPAMILASICNLTPAEETLLIQASLIMTGIASLLQLFPLFGRIGTGLPIIMGAAFAYVPVFSSIGAEFGIGTILGAEIVGGIVAIIVGLFIKYVKHLFPATVTGTVIFTIGLSLYPIAIRWMAGGEGTPGYGGLLNWFIALLTLAIVFFLTNFTKGLLSQGSLLFGIILGTIIALPFSMVDLSNLSHAGWLALPGILHFELNFAPAAMATAAIVYVVNCLQNMGGVAMTTNAVEHRIPTSKEYRGGIVSLGIMSILGAFIGAVPQSTYEQNTGIIISNGVKNRLVFLFACLVFIVAGFLPKLAALLTCIPQPVLGGAVLGVFATITMSGLELIVEGGLTDRKKLIVGTSIALGLGIYHVSGCLAGPGMPAWVDGVFGASELVVSALCAIILNLVLPKDEEALQEQEALKTND